MTWKPSLCFAQPITLSMVYSRSSQSSSWTLSSPIEKIVSAGYQCSQPVFCPLTLTTFTVDQMWKPNKSSPLNSSDVEFVWGSIKGAVMNAISHFIPQKGPHKDLNDGPRLNCSNNQVNAEEQPEREDYSQITSQNTNWMLMYRQVRQPMRSMQSKIFRLHQESKWFKQHPTQESTPVQCSV